MQARESYPHLSPITNGEEHLCLAQELSLIVTVEVGALARAGVSRDEAEQGLWNKSTNLFSCLLAVRDPDQPSPPTYRLLIDKTGNNIHTQLIELPQGSKEMGTGGN